MTKDELIAALSELQKLYGILNDIYRERALKTAVSTIQSMSQQSANEILAELTTHKYPGIGTGIISKIQEIIDGSGASRELIKLRNSRKVQAYKVFEGIIGVGPATIKRWISAGILSLPHLRKAISKGDITLNNTQRLGLHYYTDLNTRIPRSEVKALGDMMKNIIIKLGPASIKSGTIIYPGDNKTGQNTAQQRPQTYNNIIFEITGSYRRGHVDSGDIDILISMPAGGLDTHLLDRLNTAISQTSNYIDTLSKGNERLTFLYRSPVSKLVRQFDILHVAYSSYYAALLYFTGSYSFNTMMRDTAKRRGYRLNQSGLYKIKGSKLIHIPVTSEEDIFKTLGMTYVAPHLRE